MERLAGARAWPGCRGVLFSAGGAFVVGCAARGSDCVRWWHILPDQVAPPPVEIHQLQPTSPRDLSPDWSAVSGAKFESLSTGTVGETEGGEGEWTSECGGP